MTKKKAAASARIRGRKPRETKSADNSDRSAAKARSLAAIAPFKFKPGQSGNPGGRPKRDFAAEIAQAVFEQNAEMVYRAMAKALKRGSAGAFAVLAERGYGKTPQHVELGGNVTASVKVTFEDVAASPEP
jgi:hypothetical protein